jgi:uncharacterized membrane protein
MPDLIAIGYADTTTALSAMDEVERLAGDLVIQPDAVAAIVRGEDGKFRTITNQHEVGGGATWGMFWGLLFGLLFFVPIFGMAIGAAFGALGGKLAKGTIDKQFQNQVKAQVQPGTSCLFLIVEQMTTDRALEGLSKFGGTVIKTSLSKEAEAELQEALHGDEAAQA